MESNGDLTLFLGRWHLVLVHLPIGMLVLAFLFALLGRRKTYAALTPALPFMLLFGATFAVIASISGYLLSLSGGYDNRTLSFHQWLGISAAVVSVLCWALYREQPATAVRFAKLRKYRFGVLSLLVALLCITGHFGGTLTHGKGFFVDALPERLRLFFGQQPEEPPVLANVQEAMVYPDIIQPILQQRCQSCHGPKKKEGELALHTLELLMEGGESGQVLAPGAADQSELYRRLVLPVGDEERMPPKGRTPISTEQIELIAWWIDAGAPADKKVSELEQPEAIQPILLALEGGGKPLGDPLGSLPDIPPPNMEAVEKLMAKGVKIIMLAENKNQIAVNAINYSAFNDEDAQLVAALGENVLQLKLGDTQITDEGLKHIGKLTQLQQLHVENTSVSGAGLQHLQACDQLRYLNLVNTKVTDDGVALLGKLPALQHVYLYQTSVSAAGISTLAQSNTELTIDTGSYHLPALPTDTIVY